MLSSPVLTLIIHVNDDNKALHFFKEELNFELNVPNSYLVTSKLIKYNSVIASHRDDRYIQHEIFTKNPKFHIDVYQDTKMEHIDNALNRIRNYGRNSISFDAITIDYDTLYNTKEYMNLHGVVYRLPCPNYNAEFSPKIPFVPFAEYERVDISILDWVNMHLTNCVKGEKNNDKFCNYH